MQAHGFEHIRQDLDGFMPACVLIAVAELDLGTLILENGNRLTADEIANLAKCDARGCEALLDGMVALGYFFKDRSGENSRYAVKSEYAEALNSQSPDTSIPIIRHMGCVQRKWVNLTHSVRDGVPQQGVPSILGQEQDRVSFIMGMNSVAMRQRKAVVNSLVNAEILDPETKNLQILDVGGASGTYTEAFLNLLPDATATIFDLPVAISQAEKRFLNSSLKDRVTLISGDFTKNDLPTGFDFAWVSAIIHQMNRQASRQLYAKTFQALKPGGRIAIRDYVMDDSRTYPKSGALFGLNMLVNTSNGRIYSFDEIQNDLTATGYIDIRLAVNKPTMESVVVAYKPAAL